MLAVGVGVGFWAHDIGTEIAQQRVAELEERLTVEMDDSEKLRSEIAGLKAALRTEQDRVADWRRRYQEDVPSEGEQAIMDAVRERLGEGVSQARIRELVAIARDDVACEPLGPSKRFIVNNEINRGANGSVSFADGTITVTGSGTAARNANNQPEAWFDPAAPVSLNFAHPGGETSQAEGVLPVHHSVAVGNIEYRFSVVAGPRAFVLVSGEKCPLS